MLQYMLNHLSNTCISNKIIAVVYVLDLHVFIVRVKEFCLRPFSSNCITFKTIAAVYVHLTRLKLIRPQNKLMNFFPFLKQFFTIVVWPQASSVTDVVSAHAQSLSSGLYYNRIGRAAQSLQHRSSILSTRAGTVPHTKTHLYLRI